MKLIRFQSRRRLLVPALLASVLAAGGVLMAFDAARQRADHRSSQPEVRAVVRLLGTADMALSSASRWLRHPSLCEPGAAFADAPAILDADPAGAMIARPRALLAGANASSVAIRSPNRLVPAGEHTRPLSRNGSFNAKGERREGAKNPALACLVVLPFVAVSLVPAWRAATLDPLALLRGVT